MIRSVPLLALLAVCTLGPSCAPRHPAEAPQNFRGKSSGRASEGNVDLAVPDLGNQWDWGYRRRHGQQLPRPGYYTSP